MNSSLFFCLLALFSVSLSQTWQLCPGSPNHITWQDVSVNLVDREISLISKGLVDEEVTSGQVEVVVKLYGVHVFTENLNLADGVKLPCGPGILMYSQKVNIPSIAPKGAYDLQLTFKDQDTKPLTCLEVLFEL